MVMMVMVILNNDGYGYSPVNIALVPRKIPGTNGLPNEDGDVKLPGG